MKLITLTTDFGIQDTYVAQMKGVLYGRCPKARIVDVTHCVPPQSIQSAAYLIETFYACFSPQAVHVIVVDPGVGTKRDILCALSRHGIFIAPDNGVLTRLAMRVPLEIRRVSKASLNKLPSSQTFHGRDIFAPLAATMTRTRFKKAGPRMRDIVRLPWQKPHLKDGLLTGRIIHIDCFGNAITNISARDLRGKAHVQLRVGGYRLGHLRSDYMDQSRRPFLIINSAGYLEIAVCGSSAQKRLKLKIGQTARLISKPKA